MFSQTKKALKAGSVIDMPDTDDKTDNAAETETGEVIDVPADETAV